MACLALLANGEGYSDVYEAVGLWLFALLLKIHGLREVKKRQIYHFTDEKTKVYNSRD